MRKTKTFEAGDKVLVLLPVPQNPLQAKFFGPYTIEKKFCDLITLFIPWTAKAETSSSYKYFKRIF